MVDSSSTGRRRGLPGRVAVAAGFLLAALAFVLLPEAGVSCGSGAHGLTRICYPGWRVLSGTPDVHAAPNVLVSAGGLFGEVARLARVGLGVRVLAVLTLLVLAAGAASVLLPDPVRRAGAGVLAAGTGVVLLTVTALLAASAGGDAYDYVDARWTSWVGVGDGPGLSGGFWLSALLVLAAGGVAVAARRAGAEDDLRAPGPD